jgi:hypothetical protein
MLPISAADAISPAVQRTRAFLFRPFRLGTYLKFCLVAFLAEGFGGNFSSSGSGRHVANHGGSINTPFTVSPGLIAAGVAMTLLVLLFCSFLFYLITRLRFAWFHCLIHNTKQIRPGWHLYRIQATRFFWLNLVVGFCFLLAAVLVALPFAAGLWSLLRSVQEGNHLDVGVLLALVLPLIPILILFALGALAVDIVLRDWMLPHYALENATAGAAWDAVWARIRAEKGQFFGYALVRVVLPIVALIALFLVLIVPTLICVGAVAAVIAGIHIAFANATGASAVLGIFLQVLFGLAAFTIALLVGVALGGPLGTAIREYALLFYGSRYQLLGNILAPPPQASPNAPGMA